MSRELGEGVLRVALGNMHMYMGDRSDGKLILSVFNKGHGGSINAAATPNDVIGFLGAGLSYAMEHAFGSTKIRVGMIIRQLVIDEFRGCVE